MPEDQVEVAEQVEEEAPNQGQDFAAGAAAALSDEEETPVTEQKEEETEDKVKAGEEEPEKKEGEDKPPEPDEDESRGQALIEAENARKKEEEDAKAKAEDERLKAESERRPAQQALAPLDQETADILMNFADPKLFSGTVKAGDVELDLGEYVRTNPEVALVAGAMFNNMLGRLMAVGVIPTTDVLKQKFGDAWDNGIPGRFSSVEDRLFTAEIMARGIPEDPEMLISEPEFKPWFDSQKAEIKALFRSDDPRDHAKALKRYVNTRKSAAEGERQVIVDKNKDRRGKQEKVFSGTVKGGGKSGSHSSSGGGDSGDFEEGRRKALEED